MLLGLPVALLVLAELVLRIAGFGYPAGFLLESEQDGQKVLVQNNQFTWRFFGPEMARLPEPICLPNTKAPNTVRMVVFGESAALGDPQPRFGLARMLQAMLELRYPGTHFEVVNAGIVAINSNVILPIARDCSVVGADIWVVYMGNNEVVGPFGAGTVFGQQTPPLPLIRANLALKATRIGQMMDRVSAAVLKPAPDKSEWGGMEMFLNQQVQENDPRMHAVYDHFEKNLSDIIRSGRNSGASVVVSTVAVNLKDCAPFASAHRGGLSQTESNRWEQLYQSGVAAQAAGKPGEATRFFQDAAQIDDGYADLDYRAGCCELALGETTEAQKRFSLARDHDTLRFRCDSKLNGIIRSTISGFGDQGAVLADSEQTFADHSADGLPGNNLFYEHVHLNFDGNYLLARTVAPKLESLLPKEISARVQSSQPWPSEMDCARRLAWSDWDKQEALAEMLSRLNKAPFTSQLNHQEQIQGLMSSLNNLAATHLPAGIQAEKAMCLNALAMVPDDGLLHRQLAAMDQSMDDLAGAETNAQAAVNLLPSSSEDWSQLGIILAKQKKYGDALPAFRQALKLNPRDGWALQNLAQSLNDLGQREEAVREYRQALAHNPRFGLAWLGLGQILEATGRKEEADDCFRKALANRINRAPELEALARFCASRGWREAAATNFDDAIKLNAWDSAPYLEAGQNLAAMGRNLDAENYFAKAADLAPDSLQAHFLYGMELGQNSKPADAAAQFREAVRIMPNLPEARLNLGVALENTGNDAEALSQFEKALELSPGNGIAMNHAQVLRKKLAATKPQ
jgi:tetratricopeptide (TPR) repeat protein